jgi:hypothetical protein
MRLKWTYAAEDILDQLHGTWNYRRYGASSLVGARRDDSYWLRELVVRLPQRLVLASSSHARLRRNVAQITETHRLQTSAFCSANSSRVN